MRNSADVVHHGRITRKGSGMIRWLLVEAVHVHVRHAEDSYISQFYARLKDKRGGSKARMAAAAKMLRVIYKMLKERKEYVKNCPKD